MSVRPARPGEAVDIARVQVVAWRTAYQDILPTDLLEGWDEDAAAAAWRSAVIAPPTARHGVLVALERDLVVGFAAFAPGEPADTSPTRPGTTDLATLLVEPRWGRRGHGSRLLAAVADLARDRDDGVLQSWLPEGDQVSARFLESAGWAPAGWARTLDTGDEPLREVLWHTQLAEPAPDAPTRGPAADREEKR